LGKNGGLFGIGGYNTDIHKEPIKWMRMDGDFTSSYKFNIMGVSMNGHPLAGSNKFTLGFVDSGTTFSYLPAELYDSVVYHFDHFCQNANRYDNNNTQPNKYCPGKFHFDLVDNEKGVCFDYDKERFANNTQEFFLGYPIINIHTKLIDGQVSRIQWFPSEYLYLNKKGDKYCLAADKGHDYQIMFGTTLMR
jgi:hypothetical protein